MMLKHLSTFSFDTIKRPVQPTKPFFYCLLFIILGSYPTFIFVKRQAIRNTSRDLALLLDSKRSYAVVVAGTSRNGMAVHEPTLESLLNIDCVKMPINGSTPWGILQIIKRYPDNFVNTKLLIFDIEPFQFNVNSLRANVMYGRNYNAFSDFSLPRLSLDSLLRTTFGRDNRMDEKWEDFENKKNTSEINRIPSSRQSADEHMANFQFSQFIEKSLYDLLTFCKRNNIFVLINIPPAKKEYIDILKESYGNQYSMFVNLALQLNKKENVSLYIMETAESFLEDDSELFMDYGHLTKFGAIKYTTLLGNFINSNQKIRKVLCDEY